MNIVNPNDTLARRVIDIAKHNRSGEAFVKAVSTFGKLPEDAILSLHTRILVHQSQAIQGTGRRGSHGSPPRMIGARKGPGGEEMDGMDHDRSDRIESEPSRKGGLTRAGSNVSCRYCHPIVLADRVGCGFQAACS
jgi:pre-mRNA-splicing factor ATP-dependent RNA helicase DHX38/PRP16